MRRNGFTLVELIATIALMALLATVILINMVGVKDDQEQKSVSVFARQVADAACSYMDSQYQMELREACKDNSNQDDCIVPLSVLIGGDPTYGDLSAEEKEKRRVTLIDPDYVDKETNLTAEQEKDDVYVHVKWINDGGNLTKKCEFNRGEKPVFLKTFYITYNGNGGSVSRDTDEVTEGQTIASMPSASKNATAEYSYEMLGWYDAPSGGNKVDESTPITEDKVLYAHFGQTAKKYTVTVNKGANIAAVSGGGTYSYGQTVTVSATPNTNYTESGWSGATGAVAGNTRYHTTHSYGFVNWTGTKTSSSRTFSFTMPAQNVSLTANGSHTTGATGHQTYQVVGYRTLYWTIFRTAIGAGSDGETSHNAGLGWMQYNNSPWVKDYNGDTLTIERAWCTDNKYNWQLDVYVNLENGYMNYITTKYKNKKDCPEFTVSGLSQYTAQYDWR